MPKKEVSFRPMFGFGKPSIGAIALQQGASIPKAVSDAVLQTPFAQKIKREADKDKIIAELKAVIAGFEAKEAKRRELAKDGMRKLRDRTAKVRAKK